MQDLSKYKKKETVEINRRYLSLLAIGSVATIGLVFALGLLLGSRRTEPVKNCESEDVLTRLNQQAGEPDLPKALPPHSYHETLNASAEVVPTPASLPPSGENAQGDVQTEKTSLETVALTAPRGSEPAVLEDLKESDSGVFTLQVGSFADIREASLMVSKLGRAGHKAFVVSVELPDNRGTWYRVRVGPFKSKQTAWNYKRTFEEKERLPAFVVKKRG